MRPSLAVLRPGVLSRESLRISLTARLEPSEKKELMYPLVPVFCHRNADRSLVTKTSLRSKSPLLENLTHSFAAVSVSIGSSHIDVA